MCSSVEQVKIIAGSGVCMFAGAELDLTPVMIKTVFSEHSCVLVSCPSLHCCIRHNMCFIIVFSCFIYFKQCLVDISANIESVVRLHQTDWDNNAELKSTI